jgi:hypothetical protein
MTKDSTSDKFWNWFSSIAATLKDDVENHTLLQELDARVRDFDARLSWEIGPGSCEPLQLVISPNLDRDLRPRAQKIIARAPVISGWEFHSARRPKDWDFRLLLERSAGQPPVEIDVSNWHFVLLRYPDGSQEVLLQGYNLPPLNDDERWQAAAITLESILGEDLILDKINEFELVDQLEPRLADKLKPIQVLRDTILAST